MSGGLCLCPHRAAVLGTDPWVTRTNLQSGTYVLRARVERLVTQDTKDSICKLLKLLCKPGLHLQHIHSHHLLPRKPLKSPRPSHMEQGQAMSASRRAFDDALQKAAAEWELERSSAREALLGRAWAKYEDAVAVRCLL